MDNELLKILESGHTTTFLIAAVFGFFKISKMLYEGRIQDLRESKLQLQHIDLVGEKWTKLLWRLNLLKKQLW